MLTLSCSSCSKNFSRKGALTRHQLLHTGIKCRPHHCEMCGKAFSQYSGLKTHRNTHTKAKPFACGIGTCTKAFIDPSSCTRHRKETHRRDGTYKRFVPEHPPIRVWNMLRRILSCEFIPMPGRKKKLVAGRGRWRWFS